ncbi:curlin [Shewanella jiangmenensis]|uniref:curlin n=1 Tax=Shewanella jiangmenensis TaxID=2837387 RepID=UPI0032D9A6BF
MSTNKTWVLTASLLLCSFFANAEPTTDDDSTLHSLPVTLQTLLETHGRENLVELFQVGAQNQFSAEQAGSQNQLYAAQAGSGNEAKVIQVGVNNSVELRQVGRDNRATVAQIGDDNQVQLNQLGSANFTIHQIGDGASIAVTQY